MILFASATALLQLVTGGTQSIQVHASWVDDNSITEEIFPDCENTIATTAATTTIVPSPGANVERNLKFLSIQNTGTEAETIQLIHNDGTTPVSLYKITLNPGYTTTYNDLNGWITIDNTGAASLPTLVGAVSGPANANTITALAVSSLQAGTNGYILTSVSGVTAWQPAPVSFSAAGDLTGNNTEQVVIGIQGNPVSSTPATAGQFLIESPGATGSAWKSLSGDVLASTSTAGQTYVTNISGPGGTAGTVSLGDGTHALFFTQVAATTTTPTSFTIASSTGFGGASVSGAGAPFTLESGSGTVATSGTANGAAGGLFSILAGSGAAGLGSVKNGGAGGALVFSSGGGGAATSGGTNGLPGTVSIQVGGITYIGVSATGAVTLASLATTGLVLSTVGLLSSATSNDIAVSTTVNVVSAQNGAIAFASGTGLVTFAAADTAPGMTHTTTSSATGANLVFTPQAGATNGGNFVVAVQNGANTTSQNQFQISQTGVGVFAQIGGLGAGATTPTIWLLAGATAATANNYAIQATTSLFYNTPASNGVHEWGFGNTGVSIVFRNTPEMDIAGSIAVGATTGSFGGGAVGLVYLKKATTNPTAAVATGAIIYSDTSTGALTLYTPSDTSTIGPSHSFITGVMRIGQGQTAPGIIQTTLTSVGTPANYTITPQAPNGGSGTAVQNTPGSLIVALAAPGSVGTAGNEAFVQVTRNALLVAQIGYVNSSSTGNALWLSGSTSAIVPTASNFALLNNAGTLVLGNSSVFGVKFLPSGSLVCQMNGASGETVFGLNVAIGGGNLNGGTYGGGAGGCLFFKNVVTNPTSASTTGSLIYADHTTGNLSFYPISVTAPAFGIGSYGTGVGVLFVANANTVPTTNATGGGILYATSGALTYRSPGGTTTTVAPNQLAGFVSKENPEGHCPTCKADFGHDWHNDKYGGLTVCMKCLTDELGERPWIVRRPPTPMKEAA